MGKSIYAKIKVALIIALPLVVIAGVAAYGQAHNLAVLNPAGTIARSERNLIIVALLLCMIVVIPVFTLTFLFAVKYRESNTSAKYQPELDGNRIIETTWWLIPSALILTLGIITWFSSHSLDPYRPIASSVPPLTIQVVALDWKWLFIYPQQHIASINDAHIPLNTPIDFQITSDSVMNSFWIPQLGGQIYAMPGMNTQLHLMATQAGAFAGSSANISGEGFSGMKFTTEAGSQAGFDSWVNFVRHEPQDLDQTVYTQIAQPSQDVYPVYFAGVDETLFPSIINKYMAPAASNAASPSSNGSMSEMMGMGM